MIFIDQVAYYRHPLFGLMHSSSTSKEQKKWTKKCVKVGFVTSGTGKTSKKLKDFLFLPISKRKCVGALLGKLCCQDIAIIKWFLYISTWLLRKGRDFQSCNYSTARLHKMYKGRVQVKNLIVLTTETEGVRCQGQGSGQFCNCQKWSNKGQKWSKSCKPGSCHLLIILLYFTGVRPTTKQFWDFFIAKKI